EIWVGSFYYRDGNLYDRGGNIHVAESAFEQKALESLNTLYGTRQGFEMMNPLMGTNEVNVYIKEASKSEWDDVIASGETGKNIGGTIYWNSHGTKLPTTDGWKTNATTDLGHEFSHAFDDLVGFDYIAGEYSGAQTSEWRAVYRENLIREELGLPYRTHYAIKKETINPFPLIQEWQPAGPRMLDNDDKPYFPKKYLKEK
ncbi:MAG: type III secretion system effector protein, partial [Candidatus Saccharibacteria bacterium]|nr:type III secretion system effector protein [Candidatus Saccharibacteria bacterium]